MEGRGEGVEVRWAFLCGVRRLEGRGVGAMVLSYAESRLEGRGGRGGGAMGLSSTRSRATIINRMTPTKISYILDQYYLCEAKRVRCVGTVFFTFLRVLIFLGFGCQWKAYLLLLTVNGPS